jgi:hypothetical protein
VAQYDPSNRSPATARSGYAVPRQTTEAFIRAL